MKVLLFGRNGQVGWELQRSLAPLGELVALDRGSTLHGDLSRPEGLRETVRSVAPQLIVNAAAYTAVDQAEAQAQLAQTVNATAPGVLAEEAARLGALLVHYSTDYVFDGSGEAPWTETSPTGPLSVYGRSKLDGEHAVRASGCRHLILRTSWVHAARGSNFPKTMLRLARERETLRVVDDQFGAPTGADLIADVTAHAAQATLHDIRHVGTYHLAAAGATTWYACARHVIARAAACGETLKAPVDAVKPVPTRAFPTAARRPRNSRLATDRLCAAFGLAMPPWQAGVDRLVDEIVGI